MISNVTRAWVVSVSDVTASRSLNTNYTNQTGRTKFVTVSMRCTATLITDQAYSRAKLNGVSICFAGTFALASSDVIHTMTFEVPPQSVYRVEDIKSGGGNVIITTWSEAS